MESKRSYVGLAYLGKTGGGSAFFESVFLDIIESNKFRAILAMDSDVKLPHITKVINLRVPHSLRSLIFDLRWPFSLLLAAIKIFRSGIIEVVFLMPQPTDYFLALVLRLMRIRVSYVIHDPFHHKGEIWPRFRSIKSRVQISNRVYFLSSFVANHFMPLATKDKFIVVKLEARLNESIQDQEDYLPSGEFFVHIGRIKKYKGISRMLKVWEELETTNKSLLVAGSGVTRALENYEIPRNVILIDKWFSESEIWGLIEKSSGVILPYEEATQSGIAAIAVTLGVPILATKVGGLPEQLDGVANALIVENNSESIKSGIVALEKQKRIAKSAMKRTSVMQFSGELLHQFSNEKFRIN